MAKPLIAFKGVAAAKRLERGMKKAAAGLEDWQPAWKVFLPLIGKQQAAALRRFGAGVGKWEPIDPKWALRKSRLGRSRAAGFFTGRLEGELVANVGRTEFSNKLLAWGPKQRYGYIFHYGVKDRQPARPYLHWSPEMAVALMGIMSERIDQVLESALAELATKAGD